MQLWTSQGEQLERLYVTSLEATYVMSGTYYSLFCNNAAMHPNSNCIVACTQEGELDYETYCPMANAENVSALCVPMKETNLAQQCSIDFKSDELVPNSKTKTFRQVWNETLEG